MLSEAQIHIVLLYCTQAYACILAISIVKRKLLVYVILPPLTNEWPSRRVRGWAGSLPVEWVEAVVLEPHHQHGVVLRAERGGVAAQLHAPAYHSVAC